MRVSGGCIFVLFSCCFAVLWCSSQQVAGSRSEAKVKETHEMNNYPVNLVLEYKKLKRALHERGCSEHIK